MLTGYQHTNLGDEVNFIDRHSAALKIGVPSPPVARDLELDVNVFFFFFFASTPADLAIFNHSLFDVPSGRC